MANGAKLAYVRVSTEEQNEARQVEALEKYDIDKWFIEKISGKDMNRPKLKEIAGLRTRGGHDLHSRFFTYQPQRGRPYDIDE